ncbi:transmembrane protein 209-like [Teleopsis dalmanni]|uniref:transmembrane protein 209-like n=1 Tax=Teleopsis dalmanni TaxID=139649 RepID=UPI0018CD9774|nr:transmembrane protein 209-like [Teleopsis dalmanni]
MFKTTDKLFPVLKPNTPVLRSRGSLTGSHKYTKNNVTKELSSPVKKSGMLQDGLDLRMRAKSANYCLKWSVIYVILFALLFYDLSFKCPRACSKWYWVEYALTTYVAISGIICVGKYLYYILSTVPLRGTMEQQRLLQFNENDKSFVVGELDEINDNLKYNGNEITIDSSFLSWHSSFNDSRNLATSNLHSRRQGSPIHQNLSSQQMQYQSFINSSNPNTLENSNYSNNSAYASPYRYTREDLIENEESLEKYLKETSELETLNETPDQSGLYHNSNVKNAFWNYCHSAAHTLKTSIYQLAPLPTTTQKSSTNEEGGYHITDSNSEVIKKISSAKLSQYVACLRRWMSTTILERLVREIDNINATLKNRGIIEIQIGNIGLERLKKTAENQQFCNQNIPILPLIVPFLEVSSNQEYLVQRIKELARGSCIADYQWNSGSSYLGNKWDEHLPTDSAILFHLFCVYLDSQLRPLPQGGGRPFYSRYILKGDEKRSAKDTIAAVQNKANCAILCTNLIKPKFNFISEGEIHSCAYDRNNLFYVIIQFLIYMRAHHDSCLEGVNLGQSGINIMCVIEG